MKYSCLEKKEKGDKRKKKKVKKNSTHFHIFNVTPNSGKFNKIHEFFPTIPISKRAEFIGKFHGYFTVRIPEEFSHPATSVGLKLAGGLSIHKARNLALYYSGACAFQLPPLTFLMSLYSLDSSLYFSLLPPP